MIQYLKRKQLDITAYNNCIANSNQERIYAYSWYLDAVTKNWDALVLNNYEAVMPIPWKKKYFIKYITQPFFCQQLGVFSKKEINSKLVLDFLNAIPKYYLKTTLQLNAQNKLNHPKIKLKTNYILQLNIPHKSIYKNFSKGRKNAIKQAEKNNLLITTIPIEKLLDFSKKHYTFSESKNLDYHSLFNLISTLTKKNACEIIGVKNGNDLISGTIFLKDKNRITYLYSVNNDKGRKLHANSFIINHILKKYENSQLIFDFEGSIIPSIASFFKSFGAVKENYFLFSKNLG